MDEKTRAKIEELKAKIVPVLEKYPIKRAGLFGSVVRGEDTPESDVDILVEFMPGVRYSLFDIVGIENELNNNLYQRADLVTSASLSPYLESNIKDSTTFIYEK